MNQSLLDILVCPETHQPVKQADPGRIEELNQKIRNGSIRNRAGQVVREPLDGGLIRADGKFLYPVRHDIPIMLIDEAIPLE
jgi:uncharacterized protein YbaR (Trm112 family)